MIYDAVPEAIKGRTGTLSFFFNIGVYYMTYGAYYAVPYNQAQMFAWGGLSSLLALSAIGK